MFSSSSVNRSFQFTNLSAPNSSALLLWQKNRSGIDGTPGTSFCASNNFCPICDAFDIIVTSMMIPFSKPTVSLNSCISRFIGESACSPYTCHIVSVTGLSGSSFVFCEHPVKLNSRSNPAKMRDNAFFIIFLLGGVATTAYLSIFLSILPPNAEKTNFFSFHPINSGVFDGDKR